MAALTAPQNTIPFELGGPASASPLPSSWAARVRESIRAEGWDGEDALPVTSATCERGIEFLQCAKSAYPHLLEPRAIAPTAAGQLLLQWSAREWKVAVLISPTAPHFDFQSISPERRVTKGTGSNEAIEALAPLSA